jgi:hypothetical protein
VCGRLGASKFDCEFSLSLSFASLWYFRQEMSRPILASWGPSLPAAPAAARRGRCKVTIAGRSLGGLGLVGVFGGEEEGGGVSSGPEAARTILLSHVISARPSKQPLMVIASLKVYVELGSYFCFCKNKQKTSSSSLFERTAL